MRGSISVRGVSKVYGSSLTQALRRRPISLAGAALLDVSFDVQPGESVGVIGRNGAGKSTMLKLLAGVTPPTAGQLRVSGRLFPMIELNAGIDPELTGVENARMLASVMGLRRREAELALPMIQDFSELGDWWGRPVRTYSSGMLARLGFSVAVNVQADVLLIDEVLGVGDFAFQRKCVERILAASSDGTTILMVSHNPYVLQRLCDRAILLEGGRLIGLGTPAEVLPRYFAGDVSETGEAWNDVSASREQRPGSGELRVTKVGLLDEDGAELSWLRTGHPLRVHIDFEATQALEQPTFHLRLHDAQNTTIVASSSAMDLGPIAAATTGRVECRFESLPLMTGSYMLQVFVTDLTVVDDVLPAATVTVRTGPEEQTRSGDVGLVFGRTRWERRS